MDKYIYDENNGLWYELQGDYYIPCLTLPPEEEKPAGIWGSECLCVLRTGRADRREIRTNGIFLLIQK